jgi:hypothetical protein
MPSVVCLYLWSTCWPLYNLGIDLLMLLNMLMLKYQQAHQSKVSCSYTNDHVVDY